MNNMDREKIIQMMDWHQNIDIQSYAVRKAMEDSNIEYWIQPRYYKYSWENCAKVIASKDDLSLLGYLPKILEWLQDMNWPGALIILERLKKFNPILLKNDLEKTILIANQRTEIEWLEALSEFWDIQEIRNILENPAKTILEDICKLTIIIT